MTAAKIRTKVTQTDAVGLYDRLYSRLNGIAESANCIVQTSSFIIFSIGGLPLSLSLIDVVISQFVH